VLAAQPPAVHIRRNLPSEQCALCADACVRECVLCSRAGMHPEAPTAVPMQTQRFRTGTDRNTASAQIPDEGDDRLFCRVSSGHARPEGARDQWQGPVDLTGNRPKRDKHTAPMNARLAVHSARGQTP